MDGHRGQAHHFGLGGPLEIARHFRRPIEEYPCADQAYAALCLAVRGSIFVVADGLVITKHKVSPLPRLVHSTAFAGGTGFSRGGAGGAAVGGASTKVPNTKRISRLVAQPDRNIPASDMMISVVDVQASTSPKTRGAQRWQTPATNRKSGTQLLARKGLVLRWKAMLLHPSRDAGRLSLVRGL